MRQLTLFFDGSCWPNPGGTAAYGFALYEAETKLTDGHGVIGEGPWASNNFAEFHSLYQALRALSSEICYPNPPRSTHVTVKGDSQLVINILNNRYRARKGTLYWTEWQKVDEALRHFRKEGVHFTFIWIPRAQNQEVDDLSKAHLSTEERI